MNELIELIELRNETARDDERFSVESVVRDVFGDDVKITFEPYGDDD